jgi:hypothetical protein
MALSPNSGRLSWAWTARVPHSAPPDGQWPKHLTATHAGVQLAVVGEADADRISTLAVPNCHPILDYPVWSVLLVRD